MNKPDIYPVARPVNGAGGLTGTWRTTKPVLDRKKCIDCLRCWLFCPEAVISKDNLAINYNFCKGCGICATECPKKAITMVKEEEQ